MTIGVDSVTYHADNQSFNESVSLIVKEIFQTSGKIEKSKLGYVNTSRKSVSVKNSLVGVPKHDNRILIEENEYDFSEDYIKYQGLGYVEKRLLVELCHVHHSNIILTGAMGSGKTSLSNHVLHHLERNIIHRDVGDCKHCDKKPMIVKVNSNEDTPDIASTDELIEYIHDSYYEQILTKLRSSMDKEGFHESFIAALETPDGEEWKSAYLSYVDSPLF